MLKALVADLKVFLAGRRRAYIVTFNADSPAGRAVLVDLARFCRAHRTTFHADPRYHALMEGRREVYLRILYHLKLSEDDAWKLFNGGNTE